MPQAIAHFCLEGAIALHNASSGYLVEKLEPRMPVLPVINIVLRLKSGAIQTKLASAGYGKGLSFKSA